MRSVIKDDCYGNSIYSYTNGMFFKRGTLLRLFLKESLRPMFKFLMVGAFM